MSIEHIRISQGAKERLISLKKATGIQNWNVLCRWALCTSLADPSVPPLTKILTDSSVEMTWKVFGGEFQEVYLTILKQRCHQDGIEVNEENIATLFRLHLDRGISHLAGNDNITDVSGLFRGIFRHD